MFKRSLAGATLVIGLSTASLSHALSLGDIDLESSLNQPFEASIPLRDTGNLSGEQITVKLASVDDFEKAGVEYTGLLSKLDFDVSVDGDGKGIVVLKSRDPVVEPYLNFLVEVRWPSGRMLREYTVLLDLPVVSEARTSSVEAAAGGAASQAAEAAGDSREEIVMAEETVVEGETTSGPMPREGDERTALPKATKPTEYRVQHNDMLWNLANEFRPEGATVQQTMLALVKKNPEAFMDGNVNRLKSGYVLRLPSVDEAMEIQQADAVKEVRRQNAVWRGTALPSDENQDMESAPQLDATAEGEEPAMPAEEEATTEARLSIAAPGESDSEGGNGESEQLRDSLDANQEELDRAKRENAELNSRMEDLEKQLATLQRLLELKDNELASLQAQMAQAGDQPAAKQTAPAEQSQAATESLLENPLVRYGALGVLLLALIGLLVRNKKKKVASEPTTEPRLASEDTSEMEVEELGFAAAGSAEAEDEPELEHEEAIASLSEDVLDIAEPEQEETRLDDFSGLDLASDEGSVTEAAEEETSTAVDAETGDAVAEAELYIAYGRYDQAAQMLKGAISKEPQRTDLRVKLLSVYLETHDKDNFISEYDALAAMGDQAAIADVKEAMSAVEGVSDWLRDSEAPAFSGESVVAPGAVEEEEPDLDFSLDTEPTPAATPEPEEDLSFDIASLTDELETATSSEDELSFSEPADTMLDELEDHEPLVGLGGLTETPATSVDTLAEEPASEEESFDFSLDDDLNFDDLDLGETKEEGAAGLSELSLEDEGGLSLEESAPAEGETLSLDESTLDDLLGDLSLEEPEPEAETAQGEASLDELSLDDLDLDLSGGEIQEDESVPVLKEDQPAESARATDLSEFAGDADEDDLGLLGDSDEVATKLDLARAYIDMGDADGAKEMLQEVLDEGNDEQKQDANDLLSRL